MHEIAATAKEIYQVYSASCAGNKGLIETRVILSAEYLNYYKGRTEIWSLAPDCPVAIRDIEVLQDFSACMAVENILSIEIILQGSSEVQLGNHCLHNDGMPRIYLTSHGPSSTKKRVHKAGDKYRSIGIWASPRFFLETFGVDVDNLPESIQSVLINPDSGVLTLPLTASIKQTADDVFNMSYEGLRAEQYLKAKFTELLCLIAELASAPATKTAGDIALPRHKSNTLKTLMEALEQSHFLSLSLGEIATELGLCKNTLSSIFKEGYGMKLSDYFLQRRMELARKLLRERKRSVLEVALEVGYNNQSSFGRAYRQYYNCTPNQDRRATN